MNWAYKNTLLFEVLGSFPRDDFIRRLSSLKKKVSGILLSSISKLKNYLLLSLILNLVSALRHHIITWASCRYPESDFVQLFAYSSPMFTPYWAQETSPPKGLTQASCRQSMCSSPVSSRTEASWSLTPYPALVATAQNSLWSIGLPLQWKRFHRFQLLLYLTCILIQFGVL